MEIPDKINFAAQRLREGHRINRITVRDFLRHFNAERRGSAKVEAIREILESLDLTTDPDFETAWIDGPIWLRLKGGIQTTPAGPLSGSASSDGDHLGDGLEDIVLEGTPSAVKQAEEQSESAPVTVHSLLGRCCDAISRRVSQIRSVLGDSAGETAARFGIGYRIV